MHKGLNKDGNSGGINKAYCLQLAKGVYSKSFSCPRCLFVYQPRAISEQAKYKGVLS